MAKMRTFWRYLFAIGVVAAVTSLYHHVVRVNPTTVAMTFLLVVLFVSAFWGFRLAALSAVIASIGFNYFFLPPVGTFNIADPHNWIALFAFLVTAIVASNLSERARREAAHANQRRSEVERLYALSQALLTGANTLDLLNNIPSLLKDSLGSESAMLRVASSDEIYKSHPDVALDGAGLLSIMNNGELVIEGRTSYVPLRIGQQVTGVIAIAGDSLSRETLEATGSLIGIAIERVVAMDELARTKALQENDKLRSALLDSLTHEFRTPLTGIKASVTTLLAQYELNDEQRQELLTVIDEESDRLNRLVGEAAEMSKLDPGALGLEKRSISIADVIQATLNEMKASLQGRAITVNVPGDLPRVEMDSRRIQEVLRQLIQNATKYSPVNSPIRINAGIDQDKLFCSVADQGPGIEPSEQALIFDKFYRGKSQRYATHGTGMGLPICKTIIEAHGGTLSVESRVGKGSVFTLRLPLD